MAVLWHVVVELVLLDVIEETSHSLGNR